MFKTCLQLIQAASQEMGIASPSFAVGNTDLDTVQKLALLNAVGGELQRGHEWEAIDKEYRFNTLYVSTTANLTSGSAVLANVANTTNVDTTYMVLGTGVPQDTYVVSVSGTNVTISQPVTATGTAQSISFCKTEYTLPSDWDRPVDDTQWDKSKHWQMLGPLTAQEWQFLKSGYIATGPRIRYRILGGQFQIWPPQAGTEYLGFEYISNAWVTPTGQTTPVNTGFLADTDTCIFPDRLMISGLKARYFSTKGFDSSRFEAEFNQQLSIAKANDGGSRKLSMNPRLASRLIGPEQIPDSGYGS